MDIEDLKSIVIDLVAEADILKRKFVSDTAPVNYACIFCHSDEEYKVFFETTERIGKIVQETGPGPIFQIEPWETVAGILKILKIRKPDPTRIERGYVDFTLSNYEEFKETHLKQEWFKLIVREKYEMIELKDPNFDVLVYFANPPLDKQLGIR